jgi:hypothetical protein
LTYDAYNEITKEKQDKDQVQSLKEQMVLMQQAQRES